MNWKSLMRIAVFAALILNGLVLLVYFATLLATPNGPSFLISLFFGVPFFLLGVAGSVMLYRIRRLAGVYLAFSGIATFMVFKGSLAKELLLFGTVPHFIGMEASILLILLGILAFFQNAEPKNQRIFWLGLAAMLVLILAALVFSGLLSLLPSAGESHSTVPIGLGGNWL